MNTLAPLLAGIAAAQVMLAVFYTGQQFGWSRLDWRLLLGWLLLVRGENVPLPRVRAVGHLLHVVLGVASASVYAQISDNGADPFRWLAAGLMQAAVVTFCIGLLGVLHPAMARPRQMASERRRLEPPGDFGRNWGARTPLIIYLAHAAFTLASLAVVRIFVP